jgi:CheY-like chemotaxis protein/anti-sigma regulatory factor (Ser/Thr protein kinase)
MSNLLSNAMKFTVEGEVELTISTRAVDERIEVTVSVRDTGPGIPEYAHELLFEEFRQGDPSTTRVHGGSGLGLAIVSRLTNLMGGSVTLESVVGVGSTFTARVMVDPTVNREVPIDSRSVARADQTSVAQPGLRILLAEDNVVNRTIATAMLEKLGCSAAVAVDGGEAVRIAASGGIDLVLMDLQMPVLDGLEATRQIRKLDLPHQPRIVAVTANAFESDRERCLDAGMDDFIAKPFSLDDLRELFGRLGLASPVGRG